MLNFRLRGILQEAAFSMSMLCCMGLRKLAWPNFKEIHLSIIKKKGNEQIDIGTYQYHAWLTSCPHVVIYSRIGDCGHGRGLDSPFVTCEFTVTEHEHEHSLGVVWCGVGQLPLPGHLC